MALQVAIVGSGPAGCYAAERLVREAPGCRIDIIDRLPTPYGLVRAGVAPDHQSTKAITRVFDRVLTRDGVAFWGSVLVGRDIALDALRQLYDAVVIATGAAADKRLDIEGEDLPGVIGSGAFVGWYNGHPDQATTTPDFRRLRSAVVIGNGNVALDVVRLLAKTPSELAQSDIAPGIERALAAAPLRQIHIVGRRGPAEAGFSPKELGEIGALARAQPIVSEDLPPADASPNPAVIAILQDFATRSIEAKPVAIRFHFQARPEGLTGSGQVEAARFTRPHGAAALVLPADLVVSCIGYRAVDCGTLTPRDGVFTNENGRIEPGLYVVGWAKRGPSGTIATNRAEAHDVAQRLAAETAPTDRPGRDGLSRLLELHGARPVDYAGWQRIDAAERARAQPGRPREKFTDLAVLLQNAR